MEVNLLGGIYLEKTLIEVSFMGFKIFYIRPIMFSIYVLNEQAGYKMILQAQQLR